MVPRGPAVRAVYARVCAGDDDDHNFTPTKHQTPNTPSPPQQQPARSGSHRNGAADRFIYIHTHTHIMHIRIRNTNTNTNINIHNAYTYTHTHNLRSSSMSTTNL